MRIDQMGGECPSTLGEYRDLCSALGGEDCEAVEILDLKIAGSKGGRDEPVLADDDQFWRLFLPLTVTARVKPR
jgi:hypothetical protein